MNKSFCNECHQLVPARRVERDGKVYLAKDCPKCGTTETLVSSDAARHFLKRRLDPGLERPRCPDIQCQTCTCHRTPRYAFVDVTNRCNMNCPMCVDSVGSQGFTFDPPLEHFRKIFEHLATFDPKPTVALFGGEPTVRKDLFEIIKLSRSFGLNTRVLTNGIKMADPDYCAELVGTHAHLLISYDGGNREAYAQLRGSDKFFDRKQKAIENVKAQPRGKISYVSCLAWGLNDDRVPELLGFCHEQRDKLHGIYLMPLVATWDSEDFDYKPRRMTTEDVEQLVADCFPDHDVQFIPLGVASEFTTIVRYFGHDPFPYYGTHPNCESLYVLVSDGETYQPIDRFLRTTLPGAAERVMKLEEKLRAREKRWATSLVGRALGAVGLKRFALRTLARLGLGWLLLRLIRFGRILRGRGLGKLYHLGAFLFKKLILRRKSRQVRAEHLTMLDALRVIILPLEDDPILETERLERCPSTHVTYNPKTGEFKYIPVCSWRLHNRQVLGEIAAAYAEMGQQPEAEPEPEPAEAPAAT